MEEVIGQIAVECAKQAPSLVVFSGLVWLFLQHIKESEERQQAALTVTEKHCHEANMQTANRMAEALERIEKVVEANTEAIERMERRFDEQKRRDTL